MRYASGSLLLVLSVQGALIASLLIAGERQVDPDELMVQWQRRHAAIEQQFEARRWEEAESAARDLFQDMNVGLAKSPNGGPLLAEALKLLAAARAGLGQHEEALQDWQIAQNLNPDLRQGQLPSYGGAGAFLEASRLRRTGEPPAKLKVPMMKTIPDGVTPPVPVDVLLTSAWDGLEVEAVIDASGRVREPVVLHGRLPVMTCAALRALYDWRFEPARSDGVPVAVLHKLHATSPVIIRWKPARRVPGMAGAVDLRLIVDRKGNATEVEVLSGLPTGVPDVYAVNAAKTWKFEPATLSGVPVRAEYRVRFDVRHVRRLPS